MKLIYIRSLFAPCNILLLLFVFINKGYGQSSNYITSINISYVGSKTSLFNSPILISNCIEGCTPIEQKSYFSNSFDINILRTIRHQIGYQIGFGYFEYSIREYGIDISQRKYDDIISHNYFDLFTGISIAKELNQYFSHFYSARLIYERLLNNNQLLRKNNFATSVKIGLVYTINNRIQAVFDINYKMALVNYRKVTPNYIPFGLGLGFGLNFNI